MKTKINNSINMITVYRKNHMWVFDDEQVDLLEEPFVAGADTLLDKLSTELKKDTVNLVFSSTKFPDSKLTLNKKEGEIEIGTDYFCEELNRDLWLCPALGKYFKKSPKTIYLNYN